MTSLSRKWNRKRFGAKVFKERREASSKPKPLTVKVYADGSYHALHPTKGWRFVCARRAKLYAGV